MGKPSLISMSTRDLERYDVIKRLLNKQINGTTAAQQLGLSVRQIKRLKRRVKKHKAKGIVHKSRGKPSHNRIGTKERKRIVKIVKENYFDFTPTFAAEKLREAHEIDHDPKTITAIMVSAKVWKPTPAHRKEKHRAWRERKASFGEMQQFDGSYHHWFEDRSGTGESCLLASIDDATGQITHAKFDDSEGLIPVSGFWEEYLLRHGKPISLYVDKFSTYHMNNGLAVENTETKTQFKRAMETDLKITVITAHSPQAKGRVERLFATLQDRLVKELRLKNISDVKTANTFLTETFIPDYNKRFAVVPRLNTNAHRTLSEIEKKKLPSILCRHDERTVRNDWTISYRTHWYQLTKEQPVTVQKKDVVVVEERRDGTTHIRLRGKYLSYKQLPVRPQKVNQKSIAWVLPATAKLPHKPAANHPWRLRVATATRPAFTHL
jgi:hypothetical protein